MAQPNIYKDEIITLSNAAGRSVIENISITRYYSLLLFADANVLI